MTIENFSSGARCKETLRLLLLAEEEGRIPDSVKRCILLPIPTSKDKIHLTGTDKLLSEVSRDAKQGDFIAGYGIDSVETERMKEKGAIVYDATLDEIFLAENAKQTALGTLGYILSTSDKIPSDLRIGIVGYGRIGSSLLRMLLFLGANAKIFSTKEQNCIFLGENGVEAHLLPNGSPLPTNELDIIINTAPTDFSSSFKEKRLPKGLRVIELASGENFRDIEGVERLPGIPDKSYGKSAGLVYAKRILEFLSEVGKC